MDIAGIIKSITGRDYGQAGRKDVRYLFDKGAGSFLRGLVWSWLRGRASRGLMLGRGIKFISSGDLKLGRGVSLGHYSYIECSTERGVILGDRVTMREFAWLQCRSGVGERSGEVRIEDNVYIGPFAVLGAGGSLSIGRDTQIGARITISAESHRPKEGSYVTGSVSRAGVSIGRGCWIGNNVCILDGVKIGDGCVIGAGSVVTRDVPPGSVAFGVPARVARRVGSREANSP